MCVCVCVYVCVCYLQYRLVVKGALELLLVFANFTEKLADTNEDRTSPSSATSRTSRIIIDAVQADDKGRGKYN